MDEWKDLEFPIGQQGNKVSFVSALFRTTFIKPILCAIVYEREREREPIERIYIRLIDSRPPTFTFLSKW